MLKKYTVAICDFEEAYAIRLMNYMNGQEACKILALTFTKEEKLQQYLEQNGVDCILAVEQFDVKNTDKKVVALCTEEGKEGIYKYQPAGDIISEMMGILEKEHSIKTSEKTPIDGECRMIGIYSPIGRSGKTSLALALAREEGGLYIGMEEYSCVEESTTMSDVCYWIRKREEMIEKKVEECAVKEGNVWKLLSPFTYMDLKEMTVEEYAWFFEKIRQSGRFQKVIVDIGCGSLWDYSFLSLFHQVFVPILPEISREKEMHFRKVLQFVGLEKAKTTFTYVVVPPQSILQEQCENGSLLRYLERNGQSDKTNTK